MEHAHKCGLRKSEKLKIKIVTELQYIWYWFCEINHNGEYSFTELVNWQNLRKIELQQVELDIITQLFRIYNRVNNEYDS